MNGKIDKDGYLYIVRGNKLSIAGCPFVLTPTCHVKCGDWCALFGEPERNYDCKKNYFHRLELCKKTLIFKEFIDER